MVNKAALYIALLAMLLLMCQLHNDNKRNNEQSEENSKIAKELLQISKDNAMILEEINQKFNNSEISTNK